MPKLDRIPFHDPASRNFGIRPLLATRPRKRRVLWGYPINFPLDQGNEGACVGFGWCHELGALPIMYATTNVYAFDYYAAARKVDRAMGNKWPEGASVLAGAKVAKNAGMINEYRWAFGLEDVIDTLIQKGPVVLGVNWYESMYQTGLTGLVKVAGSIVGGHCITAVGYDPAHRVHGECIIWLNSWGPTYGQRGVGYIKVADLGRLLAEGGEACIATDIVRR